MRGYNITRDKFMSESQKSHLLKICEEKAIVDSLKGRKTWVTRYAMVHVALNSGLRVSEMAQLKIGDLFLDKHESYLIVRNGKRGKKRDVYIDKLLVKHLKEYLSIKKKSWEEPVENDSPLLLGQKGNHYSTTALHISFKKALEAAGMPMTFSIHSTRHTYATILLSKTNNLRFVQKQLGHVSLNMTSLYADVLPEKNQALADSINDN